MADIVISESMDEGAVETLRSTWSIEYDPSLAEKNLALAEALTDARALIVRNRTRVDGRLLKAAGKLECIGQLGSGFDNIDTAACRARHVAVYPAPGGSDHSVAEYVIAATISLLRDATSYFDRMIEGNWPRNLKAGREIAGKTLGLIGFGATAREVAWRAHALGMHIVAHDPFVDAADPAWQLARNLSLDGVIEVSDAISLHMPLNDGTRHLIGKRAFGLMKPNAVLINTAHGGIVDEDALINALSAGHPAGAALDVFETEPLTKEAGQKFSNLNNVILTPHIAGSTVEAHQRASQLIARIIGRHLDKKNA